MKKEYLDENVIKIVTILFLSHRI